MSSQLSSVDVSSGLSSLTMLDSGGFSIGSRVTTAHVIPIVRAVPREVRFCALTSRAYLQTALAIISVALLLLRNILFRLLGRVLNVVFPCFFKDVRAVVGGVTLRLNRAHDHELLRGAGH